MFSEAEECILFRIREAQFSITQTFIVDIIVKYCKFIIET
jgi:hypothetical protein